MEVTCYCIVKSKRYCLSLFDGETLFEQTQRYEHTHTKAVYIALSEKIGQWEEKYAQICKQNKRTILTIKISIGGQHHIFHDFPSCHTFISHHGHIGLNNSGYVSLPRTRSRSPSQ
jgi:hypothetical protein